MPTGVSAFLCSFCFREKNRLFYGEEWNVLCILQHSTPLLFIFAERRPQ
nr:MAG TPA: hypothetical protein [Bacteriophage sp.]